MRIHRAILTCAALCVAVLAPLLGTAPPATKTTAQYIEAQNAAGVHFQYLNSPTPNKYLIETMGGGVALLDYDGDGWLDVFLVNGAALGNPQPDNQPPDKSKPQYWNRLFRNNHDGTFTDVTVKAGVKGEGYGMGAAVGDYDNDGHEDLFVTNYGSCILYHNNGDGTFSDVTAQSGIQTEDWNMSAGFLDYDNDGYLDLFVTRYLQWNFAIGAMVCGPNIPGGRAYCHPKEFKAISNYLFHNNRNGTFTDVSGPSGIQAHPGYALGVSFGDFNNDGWTDIYVANDKFPQYLFKNNGDGTFTEEAAIAGVGYTEDGSTWSGMGTDFGDLDNDGFPDILTTALPYEYFSFFHNNGNGTFDYASVTSNLAEISRPYGGWGIHTYDFDNDGENEVFVATSHVMDNIEVTQPNLHYLEKPLLLKFNGGKFTDISSRSGEIFSRSCVARGAAFGDLDNDGDIDVVMSDYKAPAHFLRNEGGNQNHWIELDLRGTKSNRDGIGARVQLTSGSGKIQYRTVTTAGSYTSANDRRVVFGLGEENAIQQISIRWPSGTQQVIKNPPTDQILHIAESSDSTRRSGSPLRTPRRALSAGIPPNRMVTLLPVQLTDETIAEDEYREGMELLRRGNLQEASKAFKSATAARPDFVAAHYARGVALSRQGPGNFPDAVDEFLRVLHLQPDHIDARVDLSSILAQEGDNYAAAAQLEKAIALAPKNTDLYILLGRAQYDAKKNSNAIATFRKALELKPRLSVAHYGIGLVLASEGEDAKAAEEFRAALALNPRDAFSHFELARLALKQDDTEKALENLQEALHLKPDLADAHAELAKLYRRESKLAEAETEARQALRLRPGSFDALYNLAQVLQAQGKHDEAKAIYTKVDQLQQARDALGRANALNADGVQLMNQGKPEEALTAFQKALAADPTYFMAAYNQGVVLGKLGKKSEAIQALRVALRLRPDFSTGHYALGLLLRSVGDASAEEELAKARLLNQYVAQPLGRGVVEATKPK